MRETRAKSLTHTWPLGAVSAPGPGLAARAIATALLVAGVLVVVSHAAFATRAIAAALLFACARAVQRVGGRRRRVKGWVAVDGTGVRRGDGISATPLVRWDEPFGLSVLAPPDRSRLVLAFTTPRSVRYLGVRTAGVEDAARTPKLFAGTCTVADDCPCGEGDGTLDPADAEALLGVVAERAPAACGRVFLTGARGEPIVFDGASFLVGGRSFDLRAGFEWRPLVFQESGTRVAAFYQGTWIRQGEAEAVLVAAMPGAALVNRSARDARRAYGVAEDPPPRDLRVAVDHVLMAPLRQGLDRAPGALRSASSSPRPSLPRVGRSRET
jgi:hypothetical protein